MITRKRLGQLSEIIILLFAISVWLFSLYKVLSYVASLNFKIFGISFEQNFLWEYPFPKNPPLPPEPPPPPCPPPPCVSPTPTPTPPELSPTPAQPTPTPTIPFQPTPTPTTPPPVGGEGGVGGPAGPPVCGAQTPQAPNLKSVTSVGAGEVELIWDPVEPATHYSISYGPSSGNYLYGVDNVGKVTSFKVGGLGSGRYCFTVRAVNDCAPGELSNERCTGEVLGKVLGVSTLGVTGSFTETLLQILFIIGSICLGTGIKLFPASPQGGPAKRRV
ncbi:MAG: fibronectin type III domain-containing protein [Patescibacteria group bacterium]